MTTPPRHRSWCVSVVTTTLVLSLGSHGIGQPVPSELVDRVASSFRLSEELRETDREAAIAHAEKGLLAATELADTLWVAKLRMQLGHLWSAAKRRDQSLTHYLEALRCYEELRDFDGTTDALNAIGVDYYFVGYHHLALEYHLRALHNREQQSDEVRLAQSLNNLGLVYVAIEGYEEAVEFFSRSLELKRDVSTPAGVSRTLSNLGLAHYHLGQLDEALAYQHEAIQLRESIGDLAGTAYALSIIGDVRNEQGRHLEARESYDEALSLYRGSGDDHGVAEVLSHVGAMQSDMGDLRDAETSLTEAVALSAEIGDRNQTALAYGLLADVLQKRGDLAGALEAFKTGRAIESDISDEQSFGQINEMRLRYGEERRSRELALLRRDNEIKALDLRQQRLQKAALAVGFVVSLLVTGLCFMLYRQIRSSNGILAAKNEEVERANHELRSSNEELVRAHERAERLARQDVLTELTNRRGFLDVLERERARMLRSGRVFSLLLADLDRFKSVNDSYGHEAGDFVLKEVASRLRSRTRDQDTCARWGGEEFVVLLAETDVEGARVVAEELREAVASAPHVYAGNAIPVTMTLGVAAYDGSEVSDLIGRADAALLRGKARGRNCVVVFSAPDEEKSPRSVAASEV